MRPAVRLLALLLPGALGGPAACRSPEGAPIPDTPAVPAAPAAPVDSLRAEHQALRAELAAMRESHAALRRDGLALWAEVGARTPARPAAGAASPPALR